MMNLYSFRFELNKKNRSSITNNKIVFKKIMSKKIIKQKKSDSLDVTN
jgi:hypothetical protein